MQRMGPLVHRIAHRGALLLIASALVYLAGIVVAATSVFSGFSLNATTLADLGTPSATRLFYLLVAAVALAGGLGFVGTLWIWTTLPARSSRTLGLLVLEIAFLAEILFSLSAPAGSTSNPIAHGAFLIFFFGAISVSMLLLALAMLRDPRWGGVRLYTLLSGFVSLAGTVLIARNGAGALSAAGAEWISLGPWLLWLTVVGLHLSPFRVVPTSIPAIAS